MDESDEFDRYLRESGALQATLGEDLKRAWDQLAIEDSPFWRRVFCRALFAFFEGAVGSMRRHTAAAYTGLLGDGEIRVLEQRAGALENAFHAFDLYTNVNWGETPLVRGSAEWETLRTAIAIRNRITHPVQPSDIEITDADLRHLRETEELMFQLIYGVHFEVVGGLQAQLDSMERMFKKCWPSQTLRRPEVDSPRESCDM